jgi:hypothetical protein
MFHAWSDMPLSTIVFFQEPRPGIVVHSGLTALLTRDALVRNSLQCMLEEFWPAGVRAADALAKWPNSEEPNETVQVMFTLIILS